MPNTDLNTLYVLIRKYRFADTDVAFNEDVSRKLPHLSQPEINRLRDFIKTDCKAVGNYIYEVVTPSNWREAPLADLHAWIKDHSPWMNDETAKQVLNDSIYDAIK